MTNIYDLTFKELENYLIGINENAIKAKDIFYYLYKEKIDNLSEISNINKNIKANIIKDFFIKLPICIDTSSDEITTKILLQLDDNKTIESVIMKQKYGYSICASTEVGCNMNCAFCQSGKNKKERNLMPSEMVAQVLYAEKILKKPISTIAIMGIGEPFDNYKNVMDFIDIVSNDNGLAIGVRHISLSTCGIVPMIQRFTDEKRSNSLAISLHAPNNTLRNSLMPINNSYPLEELIAAIKYYTQNMNKRIFIEYIMLDKLNDTAENALELSNLLKDINCVVNLIPYNNTEIETFTRSPHNSVLKFYDILKQNNINVTMRREFGGSIKAACGQLKSDYSKTL